MTKISQDTLDKRARQVAELLGADKVVVAVKEGNNPVRRGVYDKEIEDAGEKPESFTGINPAELKGRVRNAYNSLIDAIDEYKENSEYFNEDGTLNEDAVKETARVAAKKVIDITDGLIATAKSKPLFQKLFPGLNVEEVAEPDHEPASVKEEHEEEHNGCGCDQCRCKTEAMKIFGEIKKAQDADNFEKEADQWCEAFITELRKRVKTRNFNPLLDNEDDKNLVGIRIKVGGSIRENLDKLIDKYRANGLLDDNGLDKFATEAGKEIDKLCGELGFSDNSSEMTDGFIIVDFKF